MSSQASSAAAAASAGENNDSVPAVSATPCFQGRPAASQNAPRPGIITVLLFYTPTPHTHISDIYPKQRFIDENIFSKVTY